MNRWSDALLRWYAAERRDLPWRRTSDPYAIWIAETMLQQTRVEAVIPYYERWMRRFPTLASLASADEQEVLRLWEGLGYYRRARNLHLAAECVVTEWGGQLPHTVAELKQLPGIGPYTASAVAAIAFGEQTVALDGNLRRVLARLLDYAEDTRSAAGEQFLRQRALACIPAGKAGDFNQALMDLGAAVCLPEAPRCGQCPVSRFCVAYLHGTQSARPLRRVRRAIPERVAAAGVVRRNGRVLIGRRPPGGLLGGLWEFPGGKAEAGESIDGTLRRELREELGIEVEVMDALGSFAHAYTHFRVVVYVFECRLKSGEPQALEHTQIQWTPPASLGRLPMGKIDRGIATRLQGR